QWHRDRIAIESVEFQRQFAQAPHPRRPCAARHPFPHEAAARSVDQDALEVRQRSSPFDKARLGSWENREAPREGGCQPEPMSSHTAARSKDNECPWFELCDPRYSAA